MTPPVRRPRRSRAVAVRLVLGALALAVPVWVAATRWSTLVAGHPAYPGLLAVVAAVGVVLLVRAGASVRPGRWRTAGRVLAAVGLAVVVAVSAWLRPYPADPVAVAATAPTPRVEVVDTTTTWELRPRGPGSGAGVVFFPGALVDPRAYLALLRPLAEDGAVVVVVKPPLDLAPIAVGAVDDAVRAHPEADRWAVGGHSLGGVAAVLAADGERVRGLFLWASYPVSPVTAPVVALSVSGDRDGVIDRAGLDRSRALLPPGTRFVDVPGAVHAYFGDYGPQAGDGVPAADRGTAQRGIVAATSDLVAALPLVAAPPR